MDPLGDVQNAREEVCLVDTTAICDHSEQTTKTSPQKLATIPSNPFPTTTKQNLQKEHEHSEGLHQAYQPTNVTPPASHHNQPPDSTWPEQHLQTQPENGGYWEGLPQIYVTNAQPSKLSMQHLQAKPENGGYWDDPSHVYTTNIPSDQTSSLVNNPGATTWQDQKLQTKPENVQHCEVICEVIPRLTHTTQALPSTADHPPAPVWPEPKLQAKPENGVYCEAISHVHQTAPATQPLSPSPHNHLPTVTWAEQNLQVKPENGRFREGRIQAHTSSTSTIQTLPASPLNHSAIAAWQDQNLQAKPENGRYWEGLTQVYTANANHPVLPPPHHYPPFPAWSEDNVQVQPEAGYWERLPHAFTANTTSQPVHPPHPTLHHFHPPFPSWPEQNIQIQPQAGGYWEAPFRQTGSYPITAPGTYHGPQCQEEIMLQSHMFNVSGTYDQGQVRCNDQQYQCRRSVSVRVSGVSCDKKMLFHVFVK